MSTPEIPQSIQLRDGGVYKTRGGSVVKLSASEGNTDYPWLATFIGITPSGLPRKYWVTAEGNHFHSGATSLADIVEGEGVTLTLPSKLGGVTTDDSAKKFDDGKPDLSLLPRHALEQAAYGFMAGAKKYGRWNYMSGRGLSTSRLIAAAARHLWRWASREEFDAEVSELVGRPVSNLGLALCNIMMLLELRLRGVGEDDRAPAPAGIPEGIDK